MKPKIIKKIFNPEHFIVCPPGLESTLKKEIENSKFLKFSKSTLQRGLVEGGIGVLATKQDLYFANLTLQVPSRVLNRKI